MSIYHPTINTHSKQLNKIMSILSTLQTRDNTVSLRNLQQLIMSLSSEKNIESPEQCHYYLDLINIDKQVNRLRSELGDIVRKNGDKRMVMFSDSFESFANKIFSLAPTTMHAYSTRMKKHLLEEIQFQRQRRIRAETELSEVLEIIEQNQQMKQGKQRSTKRMDSKDRKHGEIRNSLKSCAQCPVKDMQLGQLIQSIKRLQNIIDKQKQINQNLSNSIKALEKEKQKQIDALRRDKPLNSPRNSETNNLVFINQIQTLRRQNQLLKTDNDRLNQIIINLNNKLTYTKQQLSKLGKENEMKNSLSTAVHELQHQNRELKDDLVSTQNRIVALQNQKKSFEQRSKSLGKQLKQKEKDMNHMIESYERKFQMSQNFPSRMTNDPVTERMYNTSSAFKLKDMNIKNDAIKTPADYYNSNDGIQFQLPSALKKSRKQDNSGIDNDQLLRMLLIQASSLQKFLIEDLNELLLQE